MLKNRLIAVLILRDGKVVQSINFKHTNVIHYDPIHAIDSFNRWAVDEIVILNVSRDEGLERDFANVINRISKKCFVPLSAGGWIKDVEDAKLLLENGADKVVVNTQAFLNNSLVTKLAQKFGSQCIIVSIDAKSGENGKRYVAIDRGRTLTDADPVEWAKKAKELSAGELFINSIDHDGYRKGYDLELIGSIVKAVSIPVIAFGGVLTWDHLADGVIKVEADAVAAANIFHYTEHSTKKAKRHLLEQGLNFRKI